MEVFPGAYVAKLSITAASALGTAIIAILSSRIGSTVRNIDGETTTTFPFTTWLSMLTLGIEILLIVARTQSSEDRPRDDPKEVLASDRVFLVWSTTIWTLWLVDVMCVTSISNSCAWSPSTCAKIGALCAFIWIELMLLSSRLLIMAAEAAKTRLSHFIQALQKRLTPWWNLIKEPLVQIVASVGVLLSGVLASVGLLVTGLFGVVDRLFDVVGLGGMRRRLFRSLGLYKVVAGVDKVFAAMGFGDLLPTSGPQEPDPLGVTTIANQLGVGETGKGGKPSGLPVVGSLISGKIKDP